MTSRKFYRLSLAVLFSAGITVLCIQTFSGCAGSAASTDSAASNTASHAPVKEKQKEPSLTIQSPQETIYSGKALPITFSYDGEDHPEVFYYLSLRALEEQRGGSYMAPTETGLYYVLVRCLYEELTLEYRILKRPVKIFAAPFQEAVFNGSPKRIQAEADSQVPLSYSYYPNRELRDAAIKAEKENAANRVELTEIFRGYRRVDRAPTEQGTYYVWIYYPGDKNHEAAHANVQFTIHPAPAASPRK